MNNTHNVAIGKNQFLNTGEKNCLLIGSEENNFKIDNDFNIYINGKIEVDKEKIKEGYLLALVDLSKNICK
jgi:hypothetical protein